MGWQFDLYSALLGAGFTLLLIGLIYLLQEPLQRGWQEARRVVLSAFGQVTAGWEARYRERVIHWAQGAHTLADLGPLEQYFVPAHVALQLSIPDPQQEPAPAPQVLSPSDALQGHPRILLVGGPASGRTTLLAYLALTHARPEGTRVPLYLYLPALDWAPPPEGKRPRRRSSDWSRARCRPLALRLPLPPSSARRSTRAARWSWPTDGTNCPPTRRNRPPPG